MIHRVVSLPLNKTNFHKEIRHIKQIAINNGYEVKLINKLLRKKLEKHNIQQIYPITNTNTNTIYKSIPFIGNTSTKLAKLLSKENNYTCAYRTINNLGKSLINSKEKIDQLSKSGIYKLSCNDCDCIYIGQTGRDFSTRYKEHIRSWKNNRPNDSHFAKHLLEHNHRPHSTNTPTILHTIGKSTKLNIYETLEIHKHKNKNILNDQLHSNISPILRML